MRRVVDANVKIVDTERQIVPATTGAAGAFDRLKRSLDPVYDAQKKIEKATRDADAAGPGWPGVAFNQDTGVLSYNVDGTGAVLHLTPADAWTLAQGMLRYVALTSGAGRAGTA